MSLPSIDAPEPKGFDNRPIQRDQTVTQSYAIARTAPVFLVYPSGMETFVPLYEGLRNAGLRFRWFTLRPAEPLFLGRHPAQFTDHAIYW